MKKTILKTMTLVVLIAVLNTGCAIKKTDNFGTKAFKHTVNLPMNALVITGQLAELAIVGTLFVAVETVNVVTGNSKKIKNKK